MISGYRILSFLHFKSYFNRIEAGNIEFSRNTLVGEIIVILIVGVFLHLETSFLNRPIGQTIIQQGRRTIIIRHEDRIWSNGR